MKRLFLILIIFAFLIRIWGINFGLPQTSARHDEMLIISAAMRFGTGDLNPHFFDYPSLYSYLLFIFYSIYFFLGKLVGRYNSIADFAIEFGTNPTNFFLISRLLSAVLGTATVVVVYKLAENLFGKTTAFLSSLFLAFAYLHVRESHFGKIDVAFVFFVMLSILFLIRVYLHGSGKDYLLAGIFSGLATSTKYPGVLLSFPVLIVVIIRVFGKYTKKRILSEGKGLMKFIGAYIFIFFLGSPFIFLEFPEFMADILRLLKVLKEGYYGIIIPDVWWYHLRYSLFYGLGWSLFFVSLFGLLTLFIKDIKKALVLLSFPLAYYLAISQSQIAFVRYVIPLIPFLCITAAVIVKVFLVFLSRLLGGVYKPVLYVVVAILFLLPSIKSIIQFDQIISNKDNRAVAVEWIYKNIKGASSIYHVGSWLGEIQLFPTMDFLEREEAERRSEGKILEAFVSKGKRSYLRENNIDGYEEWRYDIEVNRFNFEGREQKGLPEYIVVYQSPLLIDSTTADVPISIKRLLARDYSRVQTFKAYGLTNVRRFYDQQDAFYLPYYGFSDTERSGPNIYIFMRDDGAYK